jgi:hypothetical protein
MKQTSIEWLVEQIEQYILTYGNLPFSVLLKFKKQAKEMEKQEIIDAYDKNKMGRVNYGEQYYQETFKKD